MNENRRVFLIFEHDFEKNGRAGTREANFIDNMISILKNLKKCQVVNVKLQSEVSVIQDDLSKSNSFLRKNYLQSKLDKFLG